MPGNRKRGVVLQDRDRHLLSELAVMRIIDGEMTKVVAGFGSKTQFSLRLLELTRAGFLRRFFVGTIGSGRKAVYTLSARGADAVNAQFGGIQRPEGKLVAGDRFVDHQMAINEIYLAVKYPKAPNRRAQFRRWHTFRQSISEAIKLTPDGYLEVASGQNVRAMFLEVDLGTEALKVWTEKIAYYLQLAISGEFPQRFHQLQYRVLVVANTERRLASIQKLVSKATDKIFWFATIENIKREGIWSPIWLRPTGEIRLSLL